MPVVSAFSTTIPSGPGAPGHARRFIAEQLLPWLDRRRLADAELLVSELVGNAVRHGAGHQITVQAMVAPESVRVAVSDAGGGFVPMADVEGEPTTGSGWGLALVEHLAERWGVQREAPTTVWFQLSR